MATPQDTTQSGASVQAGRILEWIDRAGYACAVAWSSSYCVTAYVGNVNFTQAVPAGATVELTGQVIHTGRTSMQVLVRVESSTVQSPKPAAAMDCILVFVSVDGSGRPKEVPTWTPSNALERQLEKNAQARIPVRQEIHAAMREEAYTDAGTTPRNTFRFLALPAASNFAGNAHGGTVMRWIDEAAYACAAQWSSNNARTIYSGGIHFYRPIRIGEVVEVDSRLIYTDARAMHVATRVRSWPVDNPNERNRTTQCFSILEDRDGAGIAQVVEPLLLSSDEDHRLHKHAQELIALRAKLAHIPKSVDDDAQG
jgi:acyl-CoA hydrolase